VHDDSCISNLRDDIELQPEYSLVRGLIQYHVCLAVYLCLQILYNIYGIWYKMNLHEPGNILVGPSKSLPSRVPGINISAAFNGLLDAIETPKWPLFCQPSKERRVFRLLLGLNIYFHLFIDAW